jgi:hypothetical protein
MKELLDVSCSVGYISTVLQSAEERAAKVNSAFIPGKGVTLAADEIFDGAAPHLVLVEPSSLLIVELSRQPKRDSLTKRGSATALSFGVLPFWSVLKAV